MSRPLFAVFKLALVLAGAVTVMGCNQANSEVQSNVITPVKLYTVPEFSDIKYDSFLADVDAGKRSQLSFQVPGVIEKLSVKNGQKVVKGELLATLDPQDYELVVKSAKAQYDLANTHYKRDKQLFDKKLISADSFDRTETSLKTARANLAQARTDLGYTQIKAPFSGVVSLSYAKPYQFVAAKQPILNIINNDSLDINTVIPVPYIDSVGIKQLPTHQFSVVFDLYSSRVIPAEFKEISTQPNVDTNSYSVTVTVTRPEGFSILTGMTGQVLIDKNAESNHFFLPQESWLTKSSDQGEVWRFNPDSQTVDKVTVKLNSFGGIASGIAAGDMIVIAGAQDLKQGQVVRAWTREGGI